MNLKMKVKSYSFWVSLASALILILKLIGQKFGFTVDEGLISDLFTSLCAILVILGIIVVPSSVQIEQKVETKKVNESVQAVDEKTINENSTNIISDVVKQNISTEEIRNNQVEMIEIKEDEVIEEVKENLEIIEETKNDVIENIDNITENNILNSSKLDVNVQDFIDKVCLKRAELSGNVMNFVEFLQNEINNIKNSNN